MIRKQNAICKTSIVNIKVTGENREPLDYCEKLMMAEAGTSNPTDIPNARIITRLLVAGYNALKGKK